MRSVACDGAAGLQSLTFGEFVFHFDGNVTLPAGLRSFSFGIDFNQCVDNRTLPAGLQNLTFGVRFNQALDNLYPPASLQSLDLGRNFYQTIYAVSVVSQQSHRASAEDEQTLYKLPMRVVESIKAMSWVVVYGVVLEGISARPCLRSQSLLSRASLLRSASAMAKRAFLCQLASLLMNS